MDIININDVVRPYKSNKDMTEIERLLHLNNLNRVRRNRCYRKKKLEQLKLKQQQEQKNTIKKVNLDEEHLNSDEEDTKALTDLYEYITIEPNDKEVLQAIDILEDKLEINEDEKLNANIDFDSSDSSDSSDTD